MALPKLQEEGVFVGTCIKSKREPDNKGRDRILLTIVVDNNGKQQVCWKTLYLHSPGAKKFAVNTARSVFDQDVEKLVPEGYEVKVIAEHDGKFFNIELCKHHSKVPEPYETNVDNSAGQPLEEPPTDPLDPSFDPFDDDVPF